MIAEFDFEIVHRPRKSNLVVDALSMLNNFEIEEPGVITKGVKREDLFKGLEQAYEKDKETKMSLENLDTKKGFCVV